METNSKLEEVAADIVRKCVETGWEESRLDEMKAFLISRFAAYGELLEIDPGDILEAVEQSRHYSAPNFYQDSTFPEVGKITVYDTLEQAKAAIGDQGFRCCACKGISRDPRACNSGEKLSGGQVCDWKVYGFLRLGGSFRFTIKQDFLANPYIDEIFMPVSMEKKES